MNLDSYTKKREEKAIYLKFITQDEGACNITKLF